MKDHFGDRVEGRKWQIGEAEKRERGREGS